MGKLRHGVPLSAEHLASVKNHQDVKLFTAKEEEIRLLCAGKTDSLTTGLPLVGASQVKRR
jgi:hypothetical protein